MIGKHYPNGRPRDYVHDRETKSKTRIEWACDIENGVFRHAGTGKKLEDVHVTAIQANLPVAIENFRNRMKKVMMIPCDTEILEE